MTKNKPYLSMLKSYENMKNAFLDQIKWSTKFTDNKIKLREGTQI